MCVYGIQQLEGWSSSQTDSCLYAAVKFANTQSLCPQIPIKDSVEKRVRLGGMVKSHTHTSTREITPDHSEHT